MTVRNAKPSLKRRALKVGNALVAGLKLRPPLPAIPVRKLLPGATRPVRPSPVPPPPEGHADLFDLTKASYGKQPHVDRLQQQGFVRDNELSNHNQSVFYHPGQNKAVLSIAGTHNENDLFTDLQVMLGQTKRTGRFLEAKDVMQKTKDKYNGANLVVTGHSLGGRIASDLPGNDHSVVTYNKYSLPGEKTKKKETSYRTPYDPASVFVSGSKNTHTFRTAEDTRPQSFLEAHDSAHLRNKAIFI